MRLLSGVDILYMPVMILITDLFYGINLCYLFVNLPMMVSVSNIMLETCNTVCKIDAIRINEKIVYLHISALLFGSNGTNDTNVLGLCMWYHGTLQCPRIWTNSGQ